MKLEVRLTHFRWSKTHKRTTGKIKCIDCNIAIDHTSVYYSFTLNLQTPGHHTNVIGLFFTHHRHLMLSHLSTALRFWQLPSAEQCLVPTNRWDALYTVQGVIVDVLGAGSSTVTRNESLELLGCHWFSPAKRYAYLYPTAK